MDDQTVKIVRRDTTVWTDNADILGRNFLRATRIPPTIIGVYRIRTMGLKIIKKALSVRALSGLQK